MCVATNAGGEAVAIGLPKCIDTGVASLLTFLPAAITFAIIEAGAFILSTLALSGSFLWHGTLISNSSEPQPHGQLSALGSIFDGGAGAFACQLRMWGVSSQPFSSPNPGTQARNRPLHFSISRFFADRVGIVAQAPKIRHQFHREVLVKLDLHNARIGTSRSSCANSAAYAKAALMWSARSEG